MTWKTHAAVVAENMRLRRIVREQQDRYRKLEAEVVELRRSRWVWLPWRGYVS